MGFKPAKKTGVSPKATKKTGLSPLATQFRPDIKPKSQYIPGLPSHSHKILAISYVLGHLAQEELGIAAGLRHAFTSHAGNMFFFNGWVKDWCKRIFTGNMFFSPWNLLFPLKPMWGLCSKAKKLGNASRDGDPHRYLISLWPCVRTYVH